MSLSISMPIVPGHLAAALTLKPEKRLRKLFGQAVTDYSMIDHGDRIMVCLSGGKDSYVMLHLLLSLKQRAPIDFSITAVNLDQKQPGFPEHVLPQYLSSINVEYHILEQDTYSIVKDKTKQGKSYCGLCSRLRRGILYNFAHEHGFNKIALGHHRDDLVETLFLNLFYGGKIKSMPPKLKSDDGRNIVIRPLVYCSEQDIEILAQILDFPIIPCTLCGSQDGLQRQAIKQMLQGWQTQHPGRIESIMKGLQNVEVSQLADRDQFDFSAF